MLPTPPPSSQPEPKTPRRKRRKSRPADAGPAEPTTPSTGLRSSRKKRRRALTGDSHAGGLITPTSVPTTPVSVVAQTPRFWVALRADTVESPGAREVREVDEVAGQVGVVGGSARKRKNEKKAGGEARVEAEKAVAEVRFEAVNTALEAEKRAQKAERKAARAERRAQKAEKKALEAGKRKRRKSRESGPLSAAGISSPRATIEAAARKETKRKKRRQSGTSSKSLSPAPATIDSTARQHASSVETSAGLSSAAALAGGDVLRTSPGASEVEEDDIDLALEMAAVADEGLEQGGEVLDANLDEPPVYVPRPPRKRRQRAAKTATNTNSTSKSVDIIEDSDVEGEPGCTTTTPPPPKTTIKSRPPREGGKPQFSPTELRAVLTTPAAVNDFLASRWLDAVDLKPLEEAGLITVKRGKFTEEERTSIRTHLETFQKTNRLSNEDLVEIIMAKRQHPSRTKYPDLWAELAAELPGRPLRNVKRAAQRLFDPRAGKGAWLPSEDADLLRAYNHTPNEWCKIALVVDRTETDCRDRWRNELRDRASRNTGPWTNDEVKRLVDAVAQANAKLGLAPDSDDVPWDEVVKLMGWTRTRTQCRKKWPPGAKSKLFIPRMPPGGWTNARCFTPNTLQADSTRQDELRFRHSRPIVDYPAAKIYLIKRLRELDYKHERDIQWAQLPTPQWNLSPAQLRFRWRDMKNSLNAEEGLPFEELLDKLEIMVGKQKNPKTRRRRGYAYASDEDDEPADDNEGWETEVDEDENAGEENGADAGEENGADVDDAVVEDDGSEDGHVSAEYESEEE